MLKNLIIFILCFFYSFFAYGSDSILNKFINKKIDGCVVTNIKYNEITKNILIVCIKDTTKVYHFYLDITAGYECGDFKCGSENVTKEVLNLLSK